MYLSMFGKIMWLHPPEIKKKKKENLDSRGRKRCYYTGMYSP